MRISRDMMFMEIAEVAARRSTCFRGNTGAVVVLDRDVVSIGYNGAPANEEHCSGNHCPLIDGGCSRAIHAEENALTRATKKVVLSNCLIYITSAPCKKCAVLISLGGLRGVIYRYPYRNREGLDRLVERIPVYQLTPSGILIDEKSREIVDA